MSQHLTPREDEIMRVIASRPGNDRSAKAVAMQLGLSPKTISSHLRCIFIKLGVHKRNEAVEKLQLV